MLSILLSWIVIVFVFLSFGSFFVFIFNKVTAQGENYSFFDEFFLGLCFTTILLSLSSFFLPSNHYILGIYIVLGIIYWIIRHKYLRQRIVSFRDKIKKIGTLYWVWIVGFGIILLLCTLFIDRSLDWKSFDSFYYHQASIRWNEDYPAIKGLANLEERFGFNSNYMLITAPFTLRFLFDTPIYAIQSAVGLIMFLWIMAEIAKFGLEGKRIVLFLLYAAFIFLFRVELNLTSTDLVPAFLIFYLGAKAVLYPQQLKSKILLYTSLPVYVITLKLSSALVAISSILFIIYLIKTKNIRSCVFLVICCLLIVIPWLGRNVILSGYLIYPFYQLDLFSVDWKVPIDIAIKESDYIAYHAKTVYVKNITDAVMDFDVKNIHFLHFITLAMALFSFILCTLLIVAKRKIIPREYLIIYIIITLNFIYLAICALSVRFGAGFIFTLFFLLACILIDGYKQKRNEPLDIPSGSYKLYDKYVKIGITCLLIYWVGCNYPKINEYRKVLTECHSLKKKTAMAMVFSKQFSSVEGLTYITYKQKRYDGFDLTLTPYVLNNGVTIYISNEWRGYLFDVIPSVPHNWTKDAYWIFQDYRNLEGRGKSVKDGFRSKLNAE